MKLLHKGLLLVLVPLIFSTGFILFVYNQMDLLDRETKRQLKAATILSAGENFVMGNMMADVTCLTYTAYKKPESERLHDLGAQKMVESLRELKELLKDRPDTMSNLKHQVERIGNDLSNQRKLMTLPGDLSLRVLVSQNPDTLKEELQNMAGGDLLGGVLDEDARTEQDAIGKSRIIWNNIQATLTGGLVMSILMTLVFGLIFNRDILQRLRNVQRNIYRISGKGMLIVPSDGRDEIAQLDEAVHETASRLRELERYKSRMITFIGEQLKKPLDSINLSLEGLKASISNDKFKNTTDGATASMARLTRLAGELLHLDQLEESKFELHVAPASLTPIVEGSIEAVSAAARAKNIQLESRIKECTFEADSDRLIQVIVNLMGNAIKFSPEGSTVTVASTVAGQRLRIEVIDRGRGIPDDFKDKVFAKYSQVEAADGKDHKGFGLGLSICKDIVEEHGGEISLTSTVGVGTTFKLDLPLVQQEKRSITQQTESQSKFGLRKWFMVDALIGQKGLVILLFPLVFQVIFIAVICSILWQGSTNMQAAAQARLEGSTAMRCSRTAMHLVDAGLFYHLYHHQWLKDTYDNYKIVLDNDFRDLRKVFLQNTDGEHRLEAAIRKGVAVVDNVVASPITEISASQLLPSEQDALDIERGCMDTSKLMEYTRDREKKVQLQQLEQAQKANVEIAWLVAGSLIVNVLLAGWLLFIAWSAISRRISRVIANTDNLLAGRTLTPPTAGKDEIAAIDSAFYSNGMKILRLQEFKQQLVSVVGHDLRTPLTSVLGVFELAIDGAMGKLPEEAHDCAVRGEEQTQELIGLINELLDIEKQKVDKRPVSTEASSLTT